jgi:hypothetical protein
LRFLPYLFVRVSLFYFAKSLWSSGGGEKRFVFKANAAGREERAGRREISAAAQCGKPRARHRRGGKTQTRGREEARQSAANSKNTRRFTRWTPLLKHPPVPLIKTFGRRTYLILTSVGWMIRRCP